MRRAAKVDRNQGEIVDALRKSGFRVDLTHAVGGGFPDMVVTGYSLVHRITMALLVEIKPRGKKLRGRKQVSFHEEFPDGGPLIVAYSERDVLDWFGR